MGALDGKNWEKWEKSQKIDFSHHISGIPGHFEVQKNWSKSSILVLFGSLVGRWDMQRCFPMFVYVYQWIKGAKNDLDQKMPFLSCIPVLK